MEQTPEERLLDLTIEYGDAMNSRRFDAYGGEPVGREPAVIAADFATAMREIVATA